MVVPFVVFGVELIAKGQPRNSPLSRRDGRARRSRLGSAPPSATQELSVIAIGGSRRGCEQLGHISRGVFVETQVEDQSACRRLAGEGIYDDQEREEAQEQHGCEVAVTHGGSR
jgi:hypothetical protein